MSSLVLPVTAAGVVPTLLARGDAGPSSVGGLLAGSALALGGLLLLAWTVGLFAWQGRGTLAPWSPPARLVVSGLYAHVRNPMISGVAGVIAGEAIALQSMAIAGWAAVFVAINHAYFLVSEEPGLARRFGQAYEEYRQNVPRWFPRCRPWRPRPEFSTR